MDVNWDLDSVMELCCSKLSPDHELHSFQDGGNIDWLDEKVDLSAWTQLDFPDDLSPVMLEDSYIQAPFHPSQSGGSSSFTPKANDRWAAPKANSHWECCAVSPYSPDYLSPPESPTYSPPTPNAVVPNVDIFINFESSNHSGTSTPRQTAQVDATLSTDSLSPPPTPYVLGIPSVSAVEEIPYAVASEPASPSYLAVYCSPSPVETPESIEAPKSPIQVVQEILAAAKSEPASPSYSAVSNSRAASPVEIVEPVSSVNSPVACGSPASLADADDADLVAFDKPLSPVSYCSAPSPVSTPLTLPTSAPPCGSPDREDDGSDDDSMDADFVPEANGSDSESGLDAPSTSKGSSRGKKRTARRRPRRSADTNSRKERKRLQNKDAATRYRQKKKQECGIVEGEFEKLAATNLSLQSEAQRVANEISYLKGLMRELFQAKGLIK